MRPRSTGRSPSLFVFLLGYVRLFPVRSGRSRLRLTRLLVASFGSQGAGRVCQLGLLSFCLVFHVSTVAPRRRSFLLVRPRGFAAVLVVLSPFVPVAMRVFKVAFDSGFSLGLLSAGSCLGSDVRLTLCSYLRVLPDGHPDQVL